MIKLCGCKSKSISGLICSVGLCQKHYNMLMFGNSEERSIARGYMQAIHMSPSEYKQYKTLNRII